MRNERILDVFPSAADGNRLVIAVQTGPEQTDQFVLRQESFSNDVGWFVQSRVSIEPEQLAGLKAALTCGRTGKLERNPQPSPRILTFESAAAG